MSFSNVLKDMLGRVDGAVSAMIIGMDGIPVEEYSVDNPTNLDDLSAETSQLMKNIDEAAESLKIGTAREFSIVSDNIGLIMRKINQEYYLALVIKPDGNYGKGRFVLRSTVPKIQGEF